LLIELADIRNQINIVSEKVDKFAKYQESLEVPVSEIVVDVKRAAEQLEQTEV
jgi:hypothetical protein